MVGILEEAQKESRAWWHVYLDNFAAGEVLEKGSPNAGDLLHDLSEEAWKNAGVISSEKKRKRFQLQAEELGAYFDGEQKLMGGSRERMLKLIQATLWLLQRRQLSRRLVQVVVGRWIHVFQFRRPAMSMLSSVWDFISGKGLDQTLVQKVRRELFCCVCMVPLLHTYLGSEPVRVLAASDASSRGGAVGIASELTVAGREYLAYSLAGGHGRPVGILVVSLFNGIGGAFRCYDLLGLTPLGLIAFDTHRPANRVTSRRWPRTRIYGDVRSLDETMVQQWVREFPDLEEVHIWAGFPCVDLSSVKAGRKGLAGEQSGLFYEVPRIITVFNKAVPRHVHVRHLAENVASMAKEECDKISEVMDCCPYYLNCVEAVPMQRPRLCWSSESLEGCMEGIRFRYGGHWTTVEAVAEYPDNEAWVTEGSYWPGGEEGYVLPTALKSIKRQRPPPVPAGYSRCDGDTLARWTADGFRFPPYHYLPRFLFWRQDQWRLANSEEKERLLGYGSGHTELCYSASVIKQSTVQWEDERLSLLGDSFSIFSFVIPAAALCKRFLGPISYQHLAKRMGMAPGLSLDIKSVCPIQRGFGYGSFPLTVSEEVKRMNQLLLRRTNHTGSDVRIATGEILNPKAVVRQSIQAGWWKWRPCFNVKWKHKDHINLLELRSILLSVRYHVHHLKHYNVRIFHLTDSYVCMSIASKGRSGSKQLNRVLRQLNATLLGYGLYLVIAHVESSQNPTDEASRL